MLDTLIAVLIEKGLDGKAKSTESALLRDALRERLAREVRGEPSTKSARRS